MDSQQQPQHGMPVDCCRWPSWGLIDWVDCLQQILLMSKA
jgi:hypothetical protein